VAAAQGVLSVVNTNMERALRRISVERGHDPRDFVLLPFGGAGGLHAADLARALRIPRIIVPTAGGALSAIGVVTADVVKDQGRTVMLEVKPGIDVKLESAFKAMERVGRAALDKEGFAPGKQRHDRTLGVRYKGQSFELEIRQTDGDIAAAFHQAHQNRYGYAQETNIVEIVSVRLRSVGLVEKLKPERLTVVREKAFAKPHQRATAYFEGRRVQTAVYRRVELMAGMKLRTPCIVVEYSATTLVPSGAKAVVDKLGNLIIEFHGRID
jgi:N-methylhydantoinase A